MKNALLVIIVLLVLVGGGYFLFRGGSSTNTNTANTSLTNESGTNATTNTADTSVTNNSGSDATINTANTSVTDNNASNATTNVNSAQPMAVTLRAGEFSFSPSTITVAKGTTVRLTLQNDGAAPHNLVIDALNVRSQTIGTGQSDTIEFTPAQTGSFTFYCSVPGHQDRGMQGTLIVQ